MEEHTILSEKIEDQFKAMEWVEEELKRMRKELGERLGRELTEEMRQFWNSKKNNEE